MLQEKTKMANGNENFDLSQSDNSKTNQSSFESNASSYFELSPGDFETSLSTLSDRTIYSSSQSQSYYDRDQEQSNNYSNEYVLQEHYTWTTSTEQDNHENPFFPSYQLSTDTPLSSQNHLGEYNTDSSIYYTANTHFSSSQSSSHGDHFRYPWEVSLSEFPRDPISASTSYYNEPNMHRAESSFFGTNEDIAGNLNPNNGEYLSTAHVSDIKEETEERF